MSQSDLPEGIRLQKVLAASGYGSRRACEVLITEGKVKVNGKVVTVLGTRVDPERDLIEVAGGSVAQPEDEVVFMLHKPRGVITTMSDPRGALCVGDLVAGQEQRLFHVGRLDTDTSGLLLLTNRGELSQRIAHPRYELKKTYVAEVKHVRNGVLPKPAQRHLNEGVVHLEDGPVKIDAWQQLTGHGGIAVVEVQIHEGRNRIIRRLFETLGHPVKTLTRTELGPLKLGKLRPGALRPVRGRELAALERAVGLRK